MHHFPILSYKTEGLTGPICEAGITFAAYCNEISVDLLFTFPPMFTF